MIRRLYACGNDPAPDTYNFLTKKLIIIKAKAFNETTTTASEERHYFDFNHAPNFYPAFLKWDRKWEEIIIYFFTGLCNFLHKTQWDHAHGQLDKYNFLSQKWTTRQKKMYCVSLSKRRCIHEKETKHYIYPVFNKVNCEGGEKGNVFCFLPFSVSDIIVVTDWLDVIFFGSFIYS